MDAVAAAGMGRLAVMETVSEAVLFTHHRLVQRLLGAEAWGFGCEDRTLV